MSLTSANSSIRGMSLARASLDDNVNSVFINFYFKNFNELSAEDQDDYLKNINACELYKALQLMAHELGTIKLEILVLTNFLQQNEPKFLIGQEKRAKSFRKVSDQQLRANMLLASAISSNQHSTRDSPFLSQSSINIGVGKRKAVDYKLNYKALAEMAEKAVTDMATYLTKYEKITMNEFKQARAIMEELQDTRIDTEETLNNFKLHFLNDDSDLNFLQQCTERQLEQKLRKFIRNWLKNAAALLGNMRLTTNSVHDKTQHCRAELRTMTDLDKNSQSIDFQLLLIKHDNFVKTNEQIRLHYETLEKLTSRTAIALSDQKQSTMKIENQIKDYTHKTKEAERIIEKMVKDLQATTKTNSNDRKRLEKFQRRLLDYIAPTVDEYLAKKIELLALEKEEKTLRRKNSIREIKVHNLLSQHKKIR